MRWQPGTDARVVGYHVYVRDAGRPYAAPEDAGMPVPDEDGTLGYIVDGLTVGAAYRFALTAYTDDGTESVLSDELALGPVNHCAVDRCTTPTQCEFSVLADGTPCGGSQRDPCSAAAVCVQGQCPSPSGLDLAMQTVRLTTAGRRGKLVASAFTVPTQSVDATRSGVALEVANPVGTVLYRAMIPPTSITTNHRKTHFWYVATAAKPLSAGGIRRMDARLMNGTLYVTVRALARELAALLPESRLTWVLRFGEECARHIDLYCAPSERGIIACG